MYVNLLGIEPFKAIKKLTYLGRATGGCGEHKMALNVKLVLVGRIQTAQAVLSH